MINSVNNPYKNFIPVTNNSYYIGQPPIPAAKTSPLQKDVFMSEEEKKKKKNNFFFSFKGIAVLAAIGGAFLALKSNKGSLGQRFNQIIEHLNDNITRMEAQNGLLNRPASLFSTVNASLSKGLKVVFEKLEYATNLIPARDIACEKAFNKVGLGCIPNGIRKLFENFTTWSHRGVFRSSASKINTNVDNLITLIEKSKATTTDPQRLTALNRWQEYLRSEFIGKFHNEFGIAAFEKRLIGYTKNIENLPELLENDLKNIHNQTGYITDNRTAPFRMPIFKGLNDVRYNMTRNKGDIYNSIKTYLGEFRLLMNANDKETRKHIVNFVDKLNKYEKANNVTSVCTELDTCLLELRKIIEQKYSKTKHYKKMVSQLDNIKGAYADGNTMGELQKILATLPDAEKKLGKKYVDNISTSLDTVVQSEMRAYQKFGEMKAGSALTDVGSLLLTVGIATWVIARAKEVEGHIEAAFKQGLPIFAALGTIIYCTARMVPNLPSLAIGMAAGLACKKAGDMTAEQYHNQIEKRKITKQALAAYNKQQQLQKA